MRGYLKEGAVFAFKDYQKGLPIQGGIKNKVFTQSNAVSISIFTYGK